ncbi:glycosyltransferase [Candidatus Dojkabacteria bacterium]|jgi:glycosyltransferase involved in cell wall biosynthesis|nr:glycosyltransferase [Candidatus Dojkabacteria bacterium]
MKQKGLKVAIVTHSLDVMGGAEKNVQRLLMEFPTAKIFCARSNKELLKKWFPRVKVRNSFIQYLPFEKYFRRELYLLYPLAYRSFSFLKYDVVISVSDGFEKFVRPWSKKTRHIAYIMTPPKFLWMHGIRTVKKNSSFSFKFYSRFVGTFLERIWQKWDRNAARRADIVIAQSKEVAKRIKEFYYLDAEIIYPPVEVKDLRIRKAERKENWFLYLGRVETYKGVDLAIRACNIAKKPLKIAGTGASLEDMKELVKSLNAKGIVKFLGFVNDKEKSVLLSKCKALLFPVQNEDFGIVPVEANACGSPVIAYREGGVLEAVSEENPKTGVFFDEYTPESLAKVLLSFDSDDYNASNCRKQATQFAGEIFQYKIRNLVDEVIKGSK